MTTSNGNGPLAAAETVADEKSGGGRTRRLAVVVVLGLGGIAVAVYAVVELSQEHRADPQFASHRWVNLDRPQMPPKDTSVGETAEQDVLRIAVAPVISPEESLQLYQDLVTWLGVRLDRTPVLLLRDSYEEVNDLLRYRRCEMAFICTYPFVQCEEEFGLEVLVVPEIGGRTTYHSLILVPSSSEARSLLDLRGKRFGSGDVCSTSGWLFPATEILAAGILAAGIPDAGILEQGENPETFFSEHVITGSHDRSVSAVASGFVDGAAVNSLVFDHMVQVDPSLEAKTRVILRSPPYGMPPVVVPDDLDPDLRRKLRLILLTMDRSASGRRILAPLHIDRFVVAEDSLFDTVREVSALMESH